ncbi:MAG: lysophospholipid acyltransferase family protein [Desulfatibacillaceae bacterium]
MLTNAIRAAKGFAMFWMFFLWGVMLAVFVVPLALFDALGGRRLGPGPRGFQAMYRGYIRVFLFLLNKFGFLRVLPPEGAPVDGPCVVVGNHPGLFDVLVLVMQIPDMSVMVAHKLSRKIPITPFVRRCGYVFGPGPDRTPLKTFKEAEARIRQGYKFQLFPEGTRSPVGGLLPFNAGFARIAAEAGVPIQPVFVENDPPFLPHGEKWYFPLREKRTVRLVFWQPVDPPEKRGERFLARELEERFREEVKRLHENRKPDRT